MEAPSFIEKPSTKPDSSCQSTHLLVVSLGQSSLCGPPASGAMSHKLFALL